MRLEKIICDLEEVEKIEGEVGVEIRGICYDSRKADKDFLFVAIKGFKEDGHKFIPDAYKKGVRAFVIEKEGYFFPDVTWIKVSSSRKALARISNIFYGFPSRELKVVGITGTNGKTTLTYLLQSIFNRTGVKTGRLSTINYDVGGKIHPAIATTPESLDLQMFLKEMLDRGVSHVFMEVSSHSLVLHRVDGVDFRWAVFTNLSPEHLDFHRSMEDYFKAKLKLFRMMLPDRRALVNLDDSYGKRILKQVRCPVVTYGIKNNADYKVTDFNVEGSRTCFKVKIRGKEEKFRIFLPGIHNIYNALAALALAVEEGVDIEIIKKGLENVRRVPGRLERIENKAGFNIYVDYAHTPSSLEQVLDNLQRLKKGRLIVVFGCGGDRDPYKRPVMGKIAFRMADYVVVTSDNPRSEDPLKIILDIEKGMKEEGAKRDIDYTIIPDRKEAIKFALGRLRENDTLLVAGKGHEKVQIFKDKIVPFDDREVTRRLLKERDLL